jgi:hypothetical protein
MSRINEFSSQIYRDLGSCCSRQTPNSTADPVPGFNNIDANASLLQAIGSRQSSNACTHY